MEITGSSLKTMEQEGAGLKGKMYIVQLYNFSPLTWSSFWPLLTRLLYLLGSYWYPSCLQVTSGGHPGHHEANIQRQIAVHTHIRTVSVDQPVHQCPKCMPLERGRKQEDLEWPCLPSIHSPASAAQPIPSEHLLNVQWQCRSSAPRRLQMKQAPTERSQVQEFVMTLAWLYYRRLPSVLLAQRHTMSFSPELRSLKYQNTSKRWRFAPMPLRRWEIPHAVEEQGLPLSGKVLKAPDSHMFMFTIVTFSIFMRKTDDLSFTVSHLIFTDR